MNSQSRISIRLMNRGLAIMAVGALATILSFIAQLAIADIAVTGTNNGTNLTSSDSGTFDLSPYTSQNTFDAPHRQILSDANSVLFSNRHSNMDVYADSTTASPGAGRFNPTTPNSAFLSPSGDPVVFATENLMVPISDISSDAINGNITFSGATVNSVFGSCLSAPAVFFDDEVNQVTYPGFRRSPSLLQLSD